MRVLLYGTAICALAALSPAIVRGILATSASALIEAMPFLLGGNLLARVLRNRSLPAYFGCGCSPGPSARSLLATAATWIVFGPFVAIARFTAAVVAARCLRAGWSDDEYHQASTLDELALLLPSALIAGLCAQFAAAIDPQRLAPPLAAAAGALLGFAAAPCGLGAVAIAASLRVHAPAAAGAFLCIAGIVDLRALRSHRCTLPRHDVLAYVMLALAFGCVAWRRGGALVHPAMTPALWLTALLCAGAAFAHRDARTREVRWGAIVALLGALVAAPAPEYRVTETTLGDLFPGERLTFTGALARAGGDCALVRYAITCCRADAVPVAVRLDRKLAYPAGRWLRIEGHVENVGGGLRLVAERVQPVTSPADPFIYR